MLKIPRLTAEATFSDLTYSQKKPAITRELLYKLAIHYPSFAIKWRSHLHQHRSRRFEDFLERLQVLSANGAVDGAVVARKTDLHHLADDDIVVLVDHWLLDRSADAENCSIVRVNDAVEVGNAEHA